MARSKFAWGSQVLTRPSTATKIAPGTHFSQASLSATGFARADTTRAAVPNNAMLCKVYLGEYWTGRLRALPGSAVPMPQAAFRQEQRASAGLPVPAQSDRGGSTVDLMPAAASRSLLLRNGQP